MTPGSLRYALWTATKCMAFSMRRTSAKEPRSDTAGPRGLCPEDSTNRGTKGRAGENCQQTRCFVLSRAAPMLSTSTYESYVLVIVFIRIPLHEAVKLSHSNCRVHNGRGKGRSKSA
jgi:hypothetical protein